MAAGKLLALCLVGYVRARLVAQGGGLGLHAHAEGCRLRPHRRPGEGREFDVLVVAITVRPVSRLSAGAEIKSLCRFHVDSVGSIICTQKLRENMDMESTKKRHENKFVDDSKRR